MGIIKLKYNYFLLCEFDRPWRAKMNHPNYIYIVIIVVKQCANSTH